MVSVLNCSISHIKHSSPDSSLFEMSLDIFVSVEVSGRASLLVVTVEMPFSVSSFAMLDDGGSNLIFCFISPKPSVPCKK